VSQAIKNQPKPVSEGTESQEEGSYNNSDNGLKVK
jgi:hypothetical protein